jgi:hypothetical protein
MIFPSADRVEYPELDMEGFSFCISVWSQEESSICVLHLWGYNISDVVIDNILFSTKKEIIDNFPVRSGIDILPTLTPRDHPCHVRTTQVNKQFDMISRLPCTTILINI